jgi:hypothetical protein
MRFPLAQALHVPGVVTAAVRRVHEWFGFSVRDRIGGRAWSNCRGRIHF